MDTYNDPVSDDGIYCDETGYFYGHPLGADCARAQNGIGDGVDNLEDDWEFLGVGAPSVYNGFPIAQTPCNWTFGRRFYSGVFSSQLTRIGSCYIQVSMLEGNPYYSSSNLENWDYIWGQAEAIRRKCVVGLGVGGSATAGKRTNYSKFHNSPLTPHRRRIPGIWGTSEHRHFRLRGHLQEQTAARHEIRLHHRRRRQLFLRRRLRPRSQKAEDVIPILARRHHDGQPAQQRRAIGKLHFVQRLRLQQRLHMRRYQNGGGRLPGRFLVGNLYLQISLQHGFERHRGGSSVRRPRQHLSRPLLSGHQRHARHPRQQHDIWQRGPRTGLAHAADAGGSLQLHVRVGGVRAVYDGDGV